MGGRSGAGSILVTAVVVSFAVLVSLPSSVQAATFVVNDTRDRVDSRPGNGVCRTSSGTCTLRAAIQEANARSGADIITLRAGTYTITRAPSNDNDITTGDFDVTSPLVINGAGATTTIIDGGTPPTGSDASRAALDRLFEIHPGAGDVTLSSLTVREGWEEKEGGAIATRTNGTLRVVDAAVVGSFAGSAGGGIHFDGYGGGSLVIERTTVRNNTTNGEGGGIYVASGRLTVTGTPATFATIADNSARAGGGIYNAGLFNSTAQAGRVNLTNVTVSGNDALADGGGIANGLQGTLTVVDSTVSANTSLGDGGGVASSSKSTLVATRATFSSNYTDGSGGGVFTHTEGSVKIEWSHFNHNASGSLLAPDTAGDGGGALAVYGSGSVSVATSTFEDNTSSGEGGGLAIHSDGPVELADLKVTDNRSAASGGGILASGKVVDVTRLVVSGNTAGESGGGLDNQGSGEFTITDTSFVANVAANGGGFSNRADSTLVVERSTLADNVATIAGGGFLHESDAATEIVNTTLSGNRAGLNGGGLYLDADAGLSVINATITENEAPYGSGVGSADAIDNFPVASHPLLVFRNTIVAGNHLGPDCHAAFGSEGGNLDGGTLCNFSGPRDRADVEPWLMPLADNGGATATHALTTLSPAWGGGVDPCPAEDQRGVEREVGRPCDAGSFEAPNSPDQSPPGGAIPDTRLDSGPAASTANTDATFTFSSSDAGASFECSLDGVPFASCSSPVEVAGLAPGEHHFEVRAVGVDGTFDPTPASYSWTVDDVTPPETQIVSGPRGVVETRDAAITFSADELDATFECSLDGVSFSACESPMTYRGLTSGAHTFAVRATDVSGNQDSTAATLAWTVAPPAETDPPTTTISGAPDVETDLVDATFVFSADEPGSTFECALDGPSFGACSSPVVLTGLNVGAHSFAVRATDPAGNVEPVPASFSWTILPPKDTAPPETNLASGPSSPTTSTSAQFTFSSTESGSTFECSLDMSPFASCSSPVTYSPLAAGDHTFEVRAVDPSGNADPTPATYVWSIELPPPPSPAVEVSLDSGPQSPTTDTTAVFHFSTVASGVTFECSLDGVALAGCTSPMKYAGLAPGDHTFEVRATDQNQRSDTATYAWTITVPPACGEPVTLIASADAWIDENSTTSNKGTDSILKVQSKAPSDNFRALVQFSMSASAPANCRVASATLSLYAASASPDRDLQAYRVATSWTEEGVTWQNKPAVAGEPVTTRSGQGYREWDVTALVQAMHTSGAANGFLIRDAEGGEGFEQQFHSREKGEQPPALTIVYSPTVSISPTL